jgi:hypothetical protein
MRDQWVSSPQVGVAELGRRAWLRAMSPQGGGGSNPPSDTNAAVHNRLAGHFRRSRRERPAP